MAVKPNSHAAFCFSVAVQPTRKKSIDNKRRTLPMVHGTIINATASTETCIDDDHIVTLCVYTQDEFAAVRRVGLLPGCAHIKNV